MDVFLALSLDFAARLLRKSSTDCVQMSPISYKSRKVSYSHYVLNSFFALNGGMHWLKVMKQLDSQTSFNLLGAQVHYAIIFLFFHLFNSFKKW